MAKKNASDLGDHIVAAAREAVAVARGEMRPARVRRIPITVRKAKAAPAERERVVEMLLSQRRHLWPTIPPPPRKPVDFCFSRS
ncbi:MAG: hypothetical protein ACREM1_17940 [Longimicrobiales bacterium]